MRTQFSTWRETVVYYLMTGLAALLAIMMHEVSHGLAANALGDNTARSQGRLSLNPLKHIDLFGMLTLIIVGFGWAKPVPVDIRHFEKPRRDMCLVALAGPFMNFLMALLAFLLLGLTYFISNVTYPFELAMRFLWMFANINVGLGVFNLFPIPPLDGSKALGVVLPDHAYFTVLRYERYGMLALMALLLTGILDRPLGFLRDVVMSWIMTAGLWPSQMIYQLIST